MKTILKVILLGDKNSGKTTYCNRIGTGDFKNEYVPTEVSNIVSCNFFTTKGEVVVNLFDLAGGEELKQYWGDVDAFFVFYDITNPNSKPDKWIEIIKNSEKKHVPIVICASKVDIEVDDERLRQIKHIPQTHFLLISAKSNYNFEKPFQYVFRQILGENCNFVAN